MVEYVDFVCENEECDAVITLGIDGGIKSLKSMPPSCLACGDDRELKPKEQDDN